MQYCCGDLEMVIFETNEDIIDRICRLTYQVDSLTGNRLVKQMQYCPFCGNKIFQLKKEPSCKSKI